MGNTPSSARERILATATDLFSREGYRAVGTDTIIERSGVAKMTLYRHFATKNDLINAYIQQTIDESWNLFDEASQAKPHSPVGQLITFFTLIAQQVAAPGFYGCACLNAVVEFPELDHPAHQISLQNRVNIKARFHELAVQAGAKEPGILADQLLMMMNGALMQGRLQGSTNIIEPLVQAARTLIEIQLPKK